MGYHSFWKHPFVVLIFYGNLWFGKYTRPKPQWIWRSVRLESRPKVYSPFGPNHHPLRIGSVCPKNPGLPRSIPNFFGWEEWGSFILWKIREETWILRDLQKKGEQHLGWSPMQAGRPQGQMTQLLKHPFSCVCFQFSCVRFQWSNMSNLTFLQLDSFSCVHLIFAYVHYTHLDSSRLMFHFQECKLLPICGITTLCKKNKMETWNSFHEYSIDSITLPATNIAPEHGWLEDEFPFGSHSIFRCKLLVSGGVNEWIWHRILMDKNWRNTHIVKKIYILYKNSIFSWWTNFCNTRDGPGMVLNVYQFLAYSPYQLVGFLFHINHTFSIIFF